jgi:hypothetical protein
MPELQFAMYRSLPRSQPMVSGSGGRSTLVTWLKVAHALRYGWRRCCVNEQLTTAAHTAQF